MKIIKDFHKVLLLKQNVKKENLKSNILFLLFNNKSVTNDIEDIDCASKVLDEFKFAFNKVEHVNEDYVSTIDYIAALRRSIPIRHINE